ncbi:hypothetical protein P73_0499 [Celeribacter indicus]|uniref:Strictosidine synthase n=2 Tax=Celeribacter indicus TaxID=1208324 RepID=A0A0B5DQ19_9RHOB|nr:hypothetical protein P73_0499 [Celeribacter indicus]
MDRFRGSGSAATSIPPMDGALRPNTRIDDADVLATVTAPDDIVATPEGLRLSSGADLLSLTQDGTTQLLRTETSEITCLASDGAGALALGLDEGRLVIRGGRHDGRVLIELDGEPVLAPSAAMFEDPDTLLVCLASRDNPMREWKRDLMTKRASGSVWRVDLASGAATCLARDLAFPYGIARTGEDGVLISESWRHRVLRLAPDGRRTAVLDELPGYPARLVPEADGPGFWLTLFAPRTQLIEFVLREEEYRQRMMDTIAPNYWIAPSLHPPSSYLEPLQGGSLKQLGELKPWAPSRSLGIVLRLDPAGHATESLHSRANGLRHGVTGCLPSQDGLIICSKGGNLVVRAKI